MSEHLRFAPDVLRRLGEELNPSPEQGILELVRNAYDADAASCTVELVDVAESGGKLVITDDGLGMTTKQLRHSWLVLGHSSKSRHERTDQFERLQVGSKGLGRLAALRLGPVAKLRTRPASKPGTEYTLVCPTGMTMTSNSLSAVLRVTLSSGLRILLPGDMDHITLNELLAANADLLADVLVFPHHGSISAVADERSFAEKLTRVVGAHTILFSVGRGVRARPSEAVLQGVFDANAAVRVACTQLSSGCLDRDAELPHELSHLTSLPAAGRASCRSCAGSMTLGGEGLVGSEVAAHQEYISATVKTPMCRTLRSDRAAPTQVRATP
jgi:hypothetical protein